MGGGAVPPYDSPRPCYDPLDFDPRTGRFTVSLSVTPRTISFDPDAPAVRRAAGTPLGSVLEHSGP